MKRYVKAATYDYDYHESHFLYPLYVDFHHAGYDLKLGDNLSLIATPAGGCAPTTPPRGSGARNGWRSARPPRWIRWCPVRPRTSMTTQALGCTG